MGFVRGSQVVQEQDTETNVPPTEQSVTNDDEHLESFEHARSLLSTNAASAIEILKQLDDSGYVPAMLELGSLYYNGRSVELSYSTAHHYFHKAASLDEFEATCWLAYLYYKGHGVRQDATEAIRLYESAAAQGYQTAIDNLTELYDQGFDVQLKHTNHLGILVEEAIEMFHEGEHAAALNLFLQCAQAGNVESLAWLGYLHMEGLGVDKNPCKALDYYRKATDGGSEAGKLWLAEAYLCGEVVPLDVDLGLSMVKELDQSGNYAPATLYLSELYSAGQVVDADSVISLTYLLRAHELEPSAETSLKLGSRYFSGLGVTADKLRAYSYYQQAALLGSELATDRLREVDRALLPEFDVALSGAGTEISDLIEQVTATGVRKFSLLITGPAGSGKQALAKYLANRLSLQTVTRTILELASPQGVSVTLQNIADAFSEASTGRMLVLDGLEHLLRKNSSNAYFNTVDAQLILATILQKLDDFMFPFVLVLTDERPPDVSFTRNFLFTVRLEYMNPQQKKLAYQRFFSQPAPEELARISKLCLQDFTRTFRKLAATGQLGSSEKMIQALKECGSGVTQADGAFDLRLVNSSENMSGMLEMLKRSSEHQFSLLLSGPPGTGKSKFLRYLAKQLDYEVIEKKASDFGSQYYYETEKGIASMFQEAAQRKAFLIIDEVETLLGERTEEQNSFKNSHTNEFLLWLESHQYPVGCTTNNVGKIDRAALRRFLFKASFDYLERGQVAAAYQMFFGRTAPESALEMGGLVPSDFSTVKRKATVFSALSDDAELVRLLKTESQGKSRSKVIQSRDFKVAFDLELVNPSMDLRLLERTLLKPGGRKDFSLLIYGPPGTGKSQYIQYLAQQIGIEVIMRKYSDLISMWRGEAERNIANAFAEAEKRRAFLVIDEIDSLLVSRGNSLQGWELAQTNEMLLAMESHPYPFAGTTNLIDGIDAAAMRRFLFNFKMDFLKPEQLEHAFRSVFNISVPDKFARFKRFTPAIFANVRKKASMFDVLHDEEKLVGLIQDEIAIYGFQEVKTPEEISVQEIRIPELQHFAVPLSEHAVEVLSAAVTVKVSGGHGSGFFISTDGYILTNQHVVQDEKFVTILLSTGREIAGEVIRFHQARDVALIKVNESGFPALPLNFKEPNSGSELFAIGSPLAIRHQNTLSKGIVSGFRNAPGSDLKLLQADTTIHSGNSGGPALDAFGNVLCISVAGIVSGEGTSLNINYFIPIADAFKHLNLKISAVGFSLQSQVRRGLVGFDSLVTTEG